MDALTAIPTNDLVAELKRRSLFCAILGASGGVNAADWFVAIKGNLSQLSVLKASHDLSLRDAIEIERQEPGFNSE